MTESYSFNDLNNSLFKKLQFLKKSNMRDRSMWPAMEHFAWSSHYSGQTLSIDRPLF